MICKYPLLRNVTWSCHRIIVLDIRELEDTIAARKAFPSSGLQLRSGFHPRSDHMGFEADKVALVWVFSMYFGFPSQFSSHQLLYIHYSYCHQLTASLNKKTIAKSKAMPVTSSGGP
jgi:hypothetical protein